jgi:microcystin-dependent protein
MSFVNKILSSKYNIAITTVIFLIIAYYFKGKSSENMTNVGLMPGPIQTTQAQSNIPAPGPIQPTQQPDNIAIPCNLKVTGGISNLQLPRGIIVAWTGVTPPEGWLMCDGTNGTPDLRGRFILGSGQGSALTVRQINQTGGEEQHTLTIDEMPSHTHMMDDGGEHTHTYHNSRESGCIAPGTCDARTTGNINSQPNWKTSADGSKHNHTIKTTGSNKPHNVLPPFWVLAYIMKM